MKKQFVILLTSLTLGSLLLTGCGSKATTTLPEQTPTVEISHSTEILPPSDTPASSDDLLSTETSVETGALLEEETGEKVETIPSTPDSQAEVATKPETVTKPQASTQPEASTKPQASTKPEASTKPQASTQPETSTKPQASTKPETAAPSTPQASKPTPTPEVKPEAPTLSAADIYSKMLEGVEIPAQNPLDDTLLKDWYGIDASILKSYKVTMPLMSMHINEYAVFEVKESKDVQTVLNGIQNRTDNMFLYPSLQEAFDARQIVTKGNYILFVIDGQSVDTIVKQFNALMK